MLLTVALTAVLTLTTPGWPQDGHGPGSTGWNPAETAVGATTIGRLDRAWTVTVAPTTAPCPAAQLAPVLDDGRMYVLDRSTNGVAAFDAATGRSLWSR